MNENDYFNSSDFLDYIKYHEIFEKTFKYVLNINGDNNIKPYHNIQHLISTFKKTQMLSEYYLLDKRNRLNLGVSALFHDVKHFSKNDSENILQSILIF